MDKKTFLKKQHCDLKNHNFFIHLNKVIPPFLKLPICVTHNIYIFDRKTFFKATTDTDETRF